MRRVSESERGLGYPIPPREEERLATIRALELESYEGDVTLTALCKLLAETLKVPIAGMRKIKREAPDNTHRWNHIVVSLGRVSQAVLPVANLRAPKGHQGCSSEASWDHLQHHARLNVICRHQPRHRRQGKVHSAKWA